MLQSIVHELIFIFKIKRFVNFEKLYFNQNYSIEC